MMKIYKTSETNRNEIRRQPRTPFLSPQSCCSLRPRNPEVTPKKGEQDGAANVRTCAKADEFFPFAKTHNIFGRRVIPPVTYHTEVSAQTATKPYAPKCNFSA